MKIGTVYDITFSTNRADTWAITNADSTPVVRVTEDWVNLAYLPTVSSISTWIYLVSINTSAWNGFEVGKRYSVYATATVNAINWAIWLDSFTMETRGIDDVLPTTSYTAPPTATEIRTEMDTNSTKLDVAVSSRLATAWYTAPPTTANIRTELTPELTTINTNLDVPVSTVGGSWGWLTIEEHDKLMSLYNSGWGWVIDITKKHEEIIEKYEKLMKNELKKIVENIPKIDISPILTAISNIPVANLSDITLALSALQWQIKLFNATIKNDYIFERNRIESEYKNEIDKKTSLLRENEYNAKEKEKIILDLSSKIASLVKIVEELQEESKEKEEEMKQIEEHYINEIEEAKKEKEEEIIEKIIPILS